MKKYIVENEEKTMGRFMAELEDAASEEAANTYDDMLDEQGDVIICSYTYSASIALKRVDPIAYRCGLSDYIGTLLEDYWYLLDCDGFVTVAGKEFEVVEYED